MTVYNAPTDTELAPEKPGKSSLFTRMRDMIIAVTEGSAGAPKIQTAALNDLSVTTPKIADSNVTTVKLESSERMNSTNVLAATSGATIGTVGSYAVCRVNLPVTVAEGATTAGNNLAYSLINTVTRGSFPVGTWRNMGDSAVQDDLSLFLRIA